MNPKPRASLIEVEARALRHPLVLVDLTRIEIPTYALTHMQTKFTPEASDETCMHRRTIGLRHIGEHNSTHVLYDSSEGALL